MKGCRQIVASGRVRSSYGAQRADHVAHCLPSFSLKSRPSCFVAAVKIWENSKLQHFDSFFRSFFFHPGLQWIVSAWLPANWSFVGDKAGVCLCVCGLGSKTTSLVREVAKRQTKWQWGIRQIKQATKLRKQTGVTRRSSHIWWCVGVLQHRRTTKTKEGGGQGGEHAARHK